MNKRDWWWVWLSLVNRCDSGSENEGDYRVCIFMARKMLRLGWRNDGVKHWASKELPSPRSTMGGEA